MMRDLPGYESRAAIAMTSPGDRVQTEIAGKGPSQAREIPQKW